MAHAAVLAAMILIGIAAVHLYWALGGEAGKAGAIPTSHGQPLIRPSPIGTAAVAVALVATAVLALATAGVLPQPLPQSFLRIACVGLALVFLARGIGDFRYVGFFKRLRGTTFGRRDTRFYSPLCVVIAGLLAASAAG